MIVGYYCAGVLDDGDVIIWCVGTKLPLLRISSPLSGGQLLSRGSTFMPIIRNDISRLLYSQKIFKADIFKDLQISLKRQIFMI